MKNLIKIFSVLMVMIGSFVFAQTDCIQLPPPLDKLVGNPIKTDQFNLPKGETLDSRTMVDFLVSYNDGIQKYAKENKIPENFSEYVNKSKENRFYEKAVKMTEAASSIEELKKNILVELRNSNDKNEISALILWNYQIQIFENSGLSDMGDATAKLGPRWKCALAIIGGAGLGALEGAGSGAIGGPYGAAAGAVLGGIFGGIAGAAAGC